MKLTSSLALIGALVGCSGPTQPVPTPTTPAPVTTSAEPVYAELFRDGASFSVTAKTTTTLDEGSPPTTEQRPPIRCTVKDVREATGVKQSTVDCSSAGVDSPTGGLAPEGIWVASDKGLWRYFPSDDVRAREVAVKGTMDPKEMLIGATPLAHQEDITSGDPDGPDEAMHYFSKVGEAGAWCFGHSAAAGDETGWTMCMSAEAGLVSGTWYQAGTTSVDTWYTATKG